MYVVILLKTEPNIVYSIVIIISYDIVVNKSDDCRWDFTDSGSLKEVTMDVSSFTDYFSENQLI